MSEIKYGNMPASVVARIKSAMTDTNGTTSYAFRAFMTDALPILAEAWPAEKKDEGPLHVGGQETVQCDPEAIERGVRKALSQTEAQEMLREQFVGKPAAFVVEPGMTTREAILALLKSHGRAMSLSEIADRLVPLGYKATSIRNKVREMSKPLLP
jgi:hypothetical protein